MPEVYYEVNRPDLNALYVNQLIQRDFSRQGSTDDWVKYLTTSKSCFLSIELSLLTLVTPPLLSNTMGSSVTHDNSLGVNLTEAYLREAAHTASIMPALYVSLH